MYERRLPSPNRRQPKTSAQDSLGARVFMDAVWGTVWLAAGVRSCWTAGDRQGTAGGHKGPLPASSPLPPLQMVYDFP